MYIFLIQEGLCGLYETGQSVFFSSREGGTVA